MALLLAVIIAACQQPASRQAVERAKGAVAKANRELEEVHASVSLPQLRGVELGPVPDAIRVTIARDGIFVDVVSFLESAPDEVRQRYIDILTTARFPYGLVEKALPLTNFEKLPDERLAGMFPPEPILEKLSQQVLFGFGNEPPSAQDLPLVIYADRSSPFELVIEVLDIARTDLRRVNRLEPFQMVWLAVEVDGRPAAIALEPPPARDPSFERPKVCAGPLAFIVEGGIGLFAQAYTLDGEPYQQAILPHEPEPKYPEWDGVLVVDEDGACPSVPNKEGKRDLARLADLSRRLTGIAPGCKVARARFGAVPEATWGDAALVAGTLLGDAGFEKLNLDTRRWHVREGCEGAWIVR